MTAEPHRARGTASATGPQRTTIALRQRLARSTNNRARVESEYALRRAQLHRLWVVGADRRLARDKPRRGRAVDRQALYVPYCSIFPPLQTHSPLRSANRTLLGVRFPSLRQRLATESRR